MQILTVPKRNPKLKLALFIGNIFTFPMKRPSLLAIVVAALFARTVSAFEINLASGRIPLPEADGSFSQTATTVGVPVHHAYYIIPQAKFATYTGAESPAAAIYADFTAGAASAGWNEIISYQSRTQGSSEFFLSEIDENGWEWPDYDTDVYFAAVFVHEDSSRPATNYIARAFSIHTPTEAEDDEAISEDGEEIVRRKRNIALEAGKWEVIAPAPLEIHCTNFAVAGGKVTATYEISEYSRLGELVVPGFPGAVQVVAASDLSRNVITNIPAQVLSSSGTPGATGTFTLDFDIPAPASWPSLFILGLEKPQQ